jgi:DNA-3-methyladenine glycosylase
MSAPFPPAFFLRPTVAVARDLLGARLVRTLPDGVLIGRIVETEAYLQDDPACHGVRETPDGCTHRRTARNATMFGPPGRAYVYFTYGNHFMVNVVTQPEGIPEAVLIRALEPLEGCEIMAHLRRQDDPRAFASGPGKLTQALAITAALDGHDLALPPLQLLQGDPVPDPAVVTAARIGISRAVDQPWRFYEAGNPHASRRS